MSIKVNKGKLKLPKPLQSLIFEACVKDNFKILNLDVFSVLNVKNLPEHHQDPFDRILISQATDIVGALFSFASNCFCSEEI